jgi:hypothetical protein
MNICPESEFRANLNDQVFWAYVLNRHQEGDNEFFEGLAEEVLDSIPCKECGSIGACGYDSEGRAMIHTEQESEDD